MLAIQIGDRAERELPNVGMLVLQDAETGEQILLDGNDAAFRERFRTAADARQLLRQELSLGGKPVPAAMTSKGNPYFPFRNNDRDSFFAEGIHTFPSGRHINLMTTFADQAVIAIENARLFEELQARTRELSDALQQQTATAEILRGIAVLPTDAQPVIETIATTAGRLSGSTDVWLNILEGEELHVVAGELVASEPQDGEREGDRNRHIDRAEQQTGDDLAHDHRAASGDGERDLVGAAGRDAVLSGRGFHPVS